jgi:hypothetical protein
MGTIEFFALSAPFNRAENFYISVSLNIVLLEQVFYRFKVKIAEITAVELLNEAY